MLERLVVLQAICELPPARVADAVDRQLQGPQYAVGAQRFGESLRYEAGQQSWRAMYMQLGITVQKGTPYAKELGLDVLDLGHERHGGGGSSKSGAEVGPVAVAWRVSSERRRRGSGEAPR